MVRTREFDTAMALDRATDVFWRAGYDGCNIADLVKATGVARYGLYQAFGGKDDMFIASLENYRGRLNRERLSKLSAEGADLNDLEAHFRLMLEKGTRREWNGCFACAAAMERSVVDERVARVVEAMFADVRSAFRNALRNAVRKGQVRDLPIEMLTEFALGVLRHLSTLIRSGADRMEIQNYIDCSLALLAP